PLERQQAPGARHPGRAHHARAEPNVMLQCNHRPTGPTLHNREVDMRTKPMAGEIRQPAPSRRGPSPACPPKEVRVRRTAGHLLRRLSPADPQTAGAPKVRPLAQPAATPQDLTS